MISGEKVRVAVIGAGMMGAGHAACIAQSGRAQLMAVADIDLGRARELADQFGADACRDHSEMLARRDVDAVVVCTPDWAHLEVCLDAAGAGKHILVEKPLAMTVADCDAIIAAADAAGVTLMIGHILRFDPRYVAARAAVDSGEIGAVSYLYARRSNTVVQPRRFGGRTTVLHYLAVHDVDWMLWAMGEPVTRVQAMTSRKVLEDLKVDDVAFLLMQFSSGAVGCVEAGWARPEHTPFDLDADLEVVGTLGAIRVDTPNSGVLVEAQRVRRIDTTYGFRVVGRTGGALREEVEHFLECVQERRTPLIDGRQARSAVAVVTAAAESARTGQPVTPAD
ncbi:MAG: Gfo/Idh/MocA family oxidoreductase [Gemmatimonadota bacterium]|nr:MAG: Gfo/Idh/MocA family oxidoreductase [Gemmatimonadota bacterium]